MTTLWSTRNALLDAAVSASSQAAGLPVSKAIVNPHLGTVWRSLSRTFQIDADFNASAALRVFGLFGASLTEAARVRILLSNVEIGDGEVLDTREIVDGDPWTADDEVPYEADDDAPYVADFILDIEAGVEPGFRQWVWCAPQTLQARYMRLWIEDETNPESFVDIGMAWAGAALDLGLDMLPGGGPGTDDPSRGRATIGGQTVMSLADRARFHRGGFDFVAEETGLGALQDLLRVQDNVLLVPDPDSDAINREAVLGRLQRSARLPVTAFGRIGFEFEIRERL